jgi:hypothetical protein
MKIDDLSDVIALRRLSLVEGSTEHKIVLVKLGMPRPFPDSSGYYAPFQITGIGSEKIKYAGGVDAIQALQLAMRMIGFDLDALNNDVGGGLKWEGDDAGHLGFL